jgi:glycerophosphoryl diester phosphodiesterase
MTLFTIYILGSQGRGVKPYKQCAGQWGPVVYLHRGNLTYAQENTFDAIVVSQQQQQQQQQTLATSTSTSASTSTSTSTPNYQNQEIDVKVLKDGSSVVFHDSNMKRLTGVDKSIKNILDMKEASNISILQEINGYKYASSNQIPQLKTIVNGLCNIDPNIGIDFDTKDKRAVKDEVQLMIDSNCTTSTAANNSDSIGELATIFTTPWPSIVTTMREELDEHGLQNYIGMYFVSGKFSFVGLKFFLKTRLLQRIAPGSSIISLHKTVHDAEQDLIQTWVDDGWCTGIWGITMDEVSSYTADYYVVDVAPEFPDPKEKTTYEDDSLLFYNMLIVMAVCFLLVGIGMTFLVVRRFHGGNHRRNSEGENASQIAEQNSFFDEDES